MKRLTIALIVLLTIAVIYLFYRINILEQSHKTAYPFYYGPGIEVAHYPSLFRNYPVCC